MAVSLFVSETETQTLKIATDLVHLRSEEPLQFIDITELVRERVRRSGVSDGFVNVQSRHTTAAIIINEKNCPKNPLMKSPTGEAWTARRSG